MEECALYALTNFHGAERLAFFVLNCFSVSEDLAFLAAVIFIFCKRMCSIFNRFFLSVLESCILHAPYRLLCFTQGHISYVPMNILSFTVGCVLYSPTNLSPFMVACFACSSRFLVSHGGTCPVSQKIYFLSQREKYSVFPADFLSVLKGTCCAYVLQALPHNTIMFQCIFIST